MKRLCLWSEKTQNDPLVRGVLSGLNLRGINKGLCLPRVKDPDDPFVQGDTSVALIRVIIKKGLCVSLG